MVFGVHCDPKKQVGTIGLRTGPVSSASDVVRVTLHGPGGHTARPEATVDLVTVMSELALKLPQVLTERVERADKGPIRLVWGAVASGDAPNVIPAKAVLTGTLRTPTGWCGRRSGVCSTSRSSRSSGSPVSRGPVPPPRCPAGRQPRRTDRAVGRGHCRGTGAEAVVPTDQSWGGDSFAWYTDRVPGTYARLGCTTGKAPPWTCMLRPSMSTSGRSGWACGPWSP